MSDTFDAKVLELTTASAVALQKVASANEAYQAREKKAAEAVPVTVAALIASGLLTAEKQAAAEKALQDPYTALDLLTKVAGKYATVRAQVGTLGGPTEKAASASYDSLKNPHVGRVGQPADTESNAAFRRGIGLG